jgi:Domain of unknown function (DUF4388)
VTALALEGDLRHFLPTEILQLLHMAQATGRLELTREAETVDVFFDGGRAVFARTSAVSVRTGEVLVHRGIVSAPAVVQALAVQRTHRPESRIGALLEAAGAVTRAQVTQAVHETVRRVLYGVLLWREGRFLFAAGERNADQDLPLEVDLDRLILEGLRIADQARAAG